MQPSEKPSILFVCTANIIRSPIAEAVFRKIIQRFPSLEGWKVGSAGVQGLVGFPADLNAVDVVRGLGIDLYGHMARKVTPDLIDEHDLILTMEVSHQISLTEAYLGQAEKIHFIGELSGDLEDVFDPLNGPLQEYLAAARDIESRLEKHYLRILLSALVYSLKRLGLPYPELQVFLPLKSKAEQEKKSKVIDEMKWAFGSLSGFPLEDQYDLLLVLLQLQPHNAKFLAEIKRVANLISPPDYESRWLKDIFYHEIVIPITCLDRMGERIFVHPAVQDELDKIRMRLNDPKCQQLNSNLEKLFNRNLNDQKYLFNIWDLEAKYKGLPHNVKEYVEAYQILHQKYHPVD